MCISGRLGAIVVSKNFPPCLSILRPREEITPVIIDVSSETERNTISPKILSKMRVPFKTYFRPSGVSDESYINAIDPKWSGGLPYSALYRGGKIVEKWIGAVSLGALRKRLEQLCR